DPRRRVGLRLVRRRAHGRRPHRAGAQEARRLSHHHHRARRRVPARVAAARRREHVTRRTRRLRPRPLVALGARPLGTLVITAAVTAGLARRTATNSARNDLAEHTPVVADELNQLVSLLPAARTANNTVAGRRQIRRIRALVETTLSVSNGSIVAIDADGNVKEFLGGALGLEQAQVALPNGVSASDLDVASLQSGK